MGCTSIYRPFYCPLRSLWSLYKAESMAHCNLNLFVILKILTTNIECLFISAKTKKVPQRIRLLRHKNDGLSISFLGVFFPTSPLILLIIWRHMAEFWDTLSPYITNSPFKAYKAMYFFCGGWGLFTMWKIKTGGCASGIKVIHFQWVWKDRN